MNAHTIPTADTNITLADRLAYIEERGKVCRRMSEARDRAWKIVDRLMPPVTRAPHGFHQPDAFFDALYYNGERHDLFHMIKPLIDDKIAARGHLI